MRIISVAKCSIAYRLRSGRNTVQVWGWKGSCALPWLVGSAPVLE